MSDPLEQAARLKDPVEHSNAFLGALIGAAIGLAIGIAIVATGPVGIAALLTMKGAFFALGVAATGSGLLQWLGSKIPKTEPGVRTGAPTVTVGGRDRNAARVKDEVECCSEKIASGTKTITIEQELATRATEKTVCAGKLKKDECCPTVYYGGPSEQVLAIRLSGELPMWFWVGREILGLVGPGKLKYYRRLGSLRSWGAMFRLAGRKGWLRGGVFLLNHGLEVADLAHKGLQVGTRLFGSEQAAIQADALGDIPGYSHAQATKGWVGRANSIGDLATGNHDYGRGGGS